MHPALKGLGYANPKTGNHKAGNHAFRRYRETHLRNYTDCPEGLRNFWIGHADSTMADRYYKIKDDLPFRRTWAEKCGVGFELPPIVPNVPRIEAETAADKVA